jgi:hypothetical protein
MSPIEGPGDGTREILCGVVDNPEVFPVRD